MSKRKKPLLSEEFLSKYPDFPEEMNALGKFVYYRTYSRWLPGERRRETWKETCARAASYNVGLAPINEHSVDEAEAYFDNMFHLREFLSGRTLWVGGTDVAKKFPMSNFNCAFTIIDSWQSFRDLHYLLLIGTGVGMRILKRDVEKLKPVRQNVELINHPYNPVKSHRREDQTEVHIKDNVATIFIGDSKEGWCDAVYEYFKILTEPVFEGVDTIKVIYDWIRPKGERLKTFGGTASGGESMVTLFEKLHNVLMTDKYAPKPVDGKLRPIHALDICNIIGSLVVCGGVRRTSEIALLDPTDQETLEAKLNITVDNSHRYMSNNSVFYEEKPTREQLATHFKVMRTNGEPGFVNAYAARLRKPTFEGVNPCCEILLEDKELCNLVTTNAMAFAHKEDDLGYLDLEGLLRAHRMNARAALRMTLVTLELPDWDKVAKSDRIVGVSLLGWYDMLDTVGIKAGSKEEKRIQRLLRSVIKDELEAYAAQLGIDVPKLATTMKPEGTISKVAGGVSPGAHRSRAPYYIRRVRVNAHDPVLKTVEKQGWCVVNEVGQGVHDSEGNYIPVTTKVVEIPIQSNAINTTLDVTAIDQLNTYYSFQRNYTEHNTSITIDVYPNEWDTVEENIWENWNEFVGVSFLERFTDFYPLLPEEVCSKEEYELRASTMTILDSDLLNEFERELDSAGEDFDISQEDGCSGGVCPIR